MALANKPNTDDLRIREIKELVPPAHLFREFPVGDKAAQTTFGGRQAIHQILHGADDRLLVVNLGVDTAPPVSTPLLAPPDRSGWRLLWSSEDPAYGGGGTPADPFSEGWRFPGNSTLLFAGASSR